ncbi:UNVERIFIED_CONTAM: hypothetical protein Sradi_3193700 [Sesamum radiatum]|uniref:Reverse transcriptase domain-containing protein n=1 Tax=Sesamum radiatum TaxID=300843 RepID=A0AAW2RF46_SESRA
MEIYVDDMLVKNQSRDHHLLDLEECFKQLNTYGVKFNPKKCVFGVGGKFLGYLVTQRGIEANPDKIQVIQQMREPQTIKEVQQLTGRMAALNRFISWAWDREPREQLLLYLATSSTAASAVLAKSKNGTHLPVYYTSHMFQGAEGRYSPTEKLLLALVCAARKLRHYFLDHPITILTDKPLKHILQRGTGSRLIKWSYELNEFDLNTNPEVRSRPRLWQISWWSTILARKEKVTTSKNGRCSPMGPLLPPRREAGLSLIIPWGRKCSS